MTRRPLIAGNWKMFKRRAEAAAFCAELVAGLDSPSPVDLALCPPLTALDAVVEGLAGSSVAVWAQNGHEAEEGAFTGEVSMAMLVDAGVTGVLLGHSERRALYAEDDEALRRKVPAALAVDLTAVLCVGESEAEREAAATEQVLHRQITTALADVDAATAAAGLVIAYEPVWAIGTGRSATPEIAQTAHAFLRAELRGLIGGAADDIRILYGGSVKPENAAELLGQPDVDGALVGGASLDPASLLAIAAAA
jgi:triosephosphate isomerase